MVARLHRHQRLLEIIAGQTVRSQHELCRLLAEEGIEVTQATLSRDLRSLGVSKGPGGYVTPDRGDDAAAADPLERTLRRELISVDHGGSTVVLRTRPGHANALAVEIDRTPPADVLGTIAGDDTIFVAVRTPEDAETLSHWLSDLAGSTGGAHDPSSFKVMS
jgi:transcriptional regulator of arginine metabolism